ncbi:FG-GAP repeat domain-containing protein [Aureliella helgolandensis]|uniref:FG-GAP repeat protein n=1 Tax=Aureliella helgolandensis TaxID=2527968 RepID=A0A518G8B5_9BACT|nr:VCBS repeat-containing protein [Aureliella helgolandensis]QDV24830.1 FG-GAP repeat protein [Aureliella helgolandensis]
MGMQAGTRILGYGLLAMLLPYGLGCSRPRSASPSAIAAESDELSDASIACIRSFCGDCHAVPLPETFPKSHWEEEVVQGYKFYIDSKRSDLVEPKRSDTIKYFRDAAPDKLTLPAQVDRRTHVQFVAATPAGLEPLAEICVSNMNWNASDATLLVSDMRSGRVLRYEVANAWSFTELGRVANACRVTPCDWDQDGATDYLVTDLGSFSVGDHHQGRVELWVDREGQLVRQALGGEFSRVVEVQPIDFDGDGDLDVIAADFGWRTTGAVRLLRNQQVDHNSPSVQTAVKVDMQLEVLDDRHGALGVEVLDLNGDGFLDYLVAFGQEYETLEAYYGNGRGEYRNQVLLELADPSYNSSSICIADVDGDGLPDIVHTNGDTMDAFLPKPYHGVRWLRNLGGERWEVQELGLLVGALQACVADFDGDGDQDIAAAGMLPFYEEEVYGPIDSVVWWEQQADGKFVRHALEQYGPSHASCVAGDVNGDGLADLIVGNWSPGKESLPVQVYLSQAAAMPLTAASSQVSVVGSQRELD